jgi:Amt family ammonium transporter
VAALAAPVYAFTATYVLLRVIGALMPLRGADDEEALGMDIVHHGEEAYATGEGALLIRAEPAEEDKEKEKVPVGDPR